MTTIVGISGSTRRGSFNAALLRAAAAVVFFAAVPAPGSATTSAVGAAFSAAFLGAVRAAGARFAGGFRAGVFFAGVFAASAPSGVRSSGEAVTVLRYQRGPAFTGELRHFTLAIRALRWIRARDSNLSVRCVVDHEMATAGASPGASQGESLP